MGCCENREAKRREQHIESIDLKLENITFSELYQNQLHLYEQAQKEAQQMMQDEKEHVHKSKQQNIRSRADSEQQFILEVYEQLCQKAQPHRMHEYENLTASNQDESDLELVGTPLKRGLHQPQFSESSIHLNAGFNQPYSNYKLSEADLHFEGEHSLQDDVSQSQEENKEVQKKYEFQHFNTIKETMQEQTSSENRMSSSVSINFQSEVAIKQRSSKNAGEDQPQHEQCHITQSPKKASMYQEILYHRRLNIPESKTNIFNKKESESSIKKLQKTLSSSDTVTHKHKESLQEEEIKLECNLQQLTKASTPKRMETELIQQEQESIDRQPKNMQGLSSKHVTNSTYSTAK